MIANPSADSESLLLAVVYFEHIICLQNLQLKSNFFLSSLHSCRKYQFSKHEKLYTLKIVITRQLQLYGHIQKYPDTQHAKWKVEEPWGGFVSADVIFVEITGAALSARRKFFVHRHARKTGAWTIINMHQLGNKSFLPRARLDFHIPVRFATRKIFTAPGNKRKTNRAPKEKKEEKQQRKTWRNLI